MVVSVAAAMRLIRRGWMRYVLVTAAVLSLLLYMYFANPGSSSGPAQALGSTRKLGAPGSGNGGSNNGDSGDEALEQQQQQQSGGNSNNNNNARVDVVVSDEETVVEGACPLLAEAKVDIATNQVFGTLNFSPRYKEYWDDNFERRYLKRRTKWNKLPLKVIVVPHSHNDPGWLKTFEGYFDAQTSDILNNMVDKLTRLPNMTFIWSEMSFFAKWWERAHPQKRSALKALLQSGRFEFVTGGWVMTDEANVHLYAMLEQLIEGHQWGRSNLDYMPKSAWSVDPFGHGATMPYVLRESGLESMVIQRIHFGWKQYLAEQQACDFTWRQAWDTTGDTDILCHNFPFDIYSIKHSCGPHPLVCLTFDFRKIRGEFTEYSQRSQPITSWNVKERAETLLAQYGRTASLFPHNVALIPLGDDFRYDQEVEWDQQYTNYKTLFDYINNHSDYHAEVRFGTVSDYFEIVRDRMIEHGQKDESAFPKLSGDFFPYSDVFVEGRPAYWTGYYTTRPFWKALCRELESHLRGTEILYSVALARSRQETLNRTRQILERDYEALTQARDKLGLFQHHDAITGTSKAYVMHDYGLKLLDALQVATKVMTHAAQYLLTERPAEAELENEKLFKKWPTFLSLPHERSGFHVPLQKLPVYIPPNQVVRIAVYNPLANPQQEAVRLIVTHVDVRVTDADDKAVPYQLNPVWNATAGPFQLVLDQYELLFLAELPPLSVVSFFVRRTEVRDSSTVSSIVIYNGGLGVDEQSTVFSVKKEQMAAEDVKLENPHLKAIFSRDTGLLEAMLLKNSGRNHKIQLQFQAYVSAQFHSGAYLFMPEPRQPVRNVSDNAPYFSVLRGAVSSEVTILYPDFLLHTIRVYHTSGSLGRGLHMENVVDFPSPPKWRENELYMRFLTDINSGSTFYSDLNGFQTIRRTTLPKLGIEGNYYPATAFTYIQDESARLSLLLTHAHGVSSWQSGWLEVMLDRRTLYDDSRGMGEGVIDNKRTVSRFTLLLEERSSRKETHPRPTLLANRMGNALNAPAHVFVVDQRNSPQLRRRVHILSRSLPCDVHLVTLRVLPVKAYFEFPSRSSLMVLHRQGFSCDYSAQPGGCSLTDGQLVRGTQLREAQVAYVTRTSLTGMQDMDMLDSLTDIRVPVMRLRSFNVTFA